MHSLHFALACVATFASLAASQGTITITRTAITVIITEPESTTIKTTTSKKPTTSSKEITTTKSTAGPVTVTITVTSTVKESTKSTKSTTSKKPTSTTKPPATTPKPEDPNTTKCPVPLYYPCGGIRYAGGCTVCVAGATCLSQNGMSYLLSPRLFS
ncbi:hypothetical protein HYFRA_00012621 [Hymenoscyphus fraxineus]|uniref:CBM1 domain-containing protein n=1 Tax=Hymenoscyphus fraxineus TaxID=746836 RepID=A0A9N9L745_9HELO|nr:hypothetical protein HYFRA_00012621 [Hymenoscyphus fraxineus]